MPTSHDRFILSSAEDFSVNILQSCYAVQDKIQMVDLLARMLLPLVCENATVYRSRRTCIATAFMMAVR